MGFVQLKAPGQPCRAGALNKTKIKWGIISLLIISTRAHTKEKFKVIGAL